MAWLIIIISLIVLWVASLCKFFCGSFHDAKAAFLDDGRVFGRNVLLVIAHPDDESMFFTPTINYLTLRGHDLYILCLSTGDADGMGSIRKEELFLASAILKIPHQQVKILDHPDLQDGFGKVWDWNLIAGFVEDEICARAIDSIITFDHYGVSGHCNHRDVGRGVQKLLHDFSERPLEAWELVSKSIFRKYSGPVDIWLSKLFALFFDSRHLQCLLNEDPSKTYAAMAQHRSQWIWFRKLFVSFSSYTYVNTLKRIH
ncbi:Hypothetical predicted protein [Olea europaea subsp. europaea]|uniref:N-acetylglucosaminylphosphatidylinositol deacetylase n=1 Tax=Olea europaea subsp. europaea TaxID=158383 RepID=A0A8S0V2X0_OLEEU|nr:Hypothetical predicted protein [Olea europaea subsp. europaea]